MYQFEVSKDGVLTDGDGDGQVDVPTGIKSAVVSMQTTSVSTLAFSDEDGNNETTVPLLGPVGQQYKIDVDNDFVATVNGDGTYTIEKETSQDEYENRTKTVLEVTANGSMHSSYKETTIVIDTDHIIYGTEVKWTTKGKLKNQYKAYCGNYASRSNLFEAYTEYHNSVSATTHMTLIFNIFVFYTLFNQINCRVIDDSLNIFALFFSFLVLNLIH